MDPVYQALFDVLETLHESCRAQISGLGQDELDWRYSEEMNSIAVLAAHIAGSERYWILDVVMDESTGRDRESEFATTGVSSHALKQQLEEALADARSAFNRLDASQLTEMRTSPRNDRKYTVAWAIAHTVEHTALHLGHMQITRQLLKSR